MLRHKLIQFAFAIALPMSWASLATAQDPATLHRVNRLYTVVVSSSSQAQHFHDLLDSGLRQAGFELAEKVDGSDATLRVEFNSESREDNSLARASYTIRNPAGRLIWSGDLVSAHRGTGPDTTVEELAQNCAERLRKDWEKGGK